jgi:uncharacterized protein YkwD
MACQGPNAPEDPGRGINPLPAANLTITDQYLNLMHEHRQTLGLTPLIHHPDLEKLARRHSEDMASQTIAFGHSGSGIRCQLAVQALGRGNLCGEIVAMGQQTPEAVLKSWLGSSGHRMQIENPRFTHTGFGYATSAKGTLYWTQIFLEAN